MIYSCLDEKVCFKKDGLALGRWCPFEKKWNAHGREKKKIKFCGLRLIFKWRTNTQPKAMCLSRFRMFGDASGVYPFIKNLIERRILWTWSRWRSRVPHSGKRRVSTQVFLFSVN